MELVQDLARIGIDLRLKLVGRFTAIGTRPRWRDADDIVARRSRYRHSLSVIP